MFNIGPLELVVLAFVGIVVLGPDRLPGLAKDAARMIRTLRELANGARTQLRDELGPEFADVDLAALNPRTAIQRALLGDDIDLASLNPRTAIQRALLGDDTSAAQGGNADATPGNAADVKPVTRPAQPPLRRDEAAPYDTDAT
jgi:sec-independent protein translocase protein TatB